MERMIIGLAGFLTFWNIVEGKMNIETMIIGSLICFFVYKFNDESFITK